MLNLTGFICGCTWKICGHCVFICLISFACSSNDYIGPARENKLLGHGYDLYAVNDCGRDRSSKCFLRLVVEELSGYRQMAKAPVGASPFSPRFHQKFHF